MWYEPRAIFGDDDDQIEIGTCDLYGIGCEAHVVVFECHGYRRRPKVDSG